MLKIINIKLFVRQPIQQTIARFYQISPKAARKARKENLINDIQKALQEKLNNRNALSVEEWKEFGFEIQKQNEKHFNSQILAAIEKLQLPSDPIQNARNFFEAFNIKQDLPTKKTMIKLFATKASQQLLNDEEEKSVIEICDEFLSSEFHVLPEINCMVVSGFCATKQWKRALDITPPTSDMHLSKIPIIEKSIRERELDLAWQYISEPNVPIKPSLLLEYWNFCKKNPQELRDNVEKMFKLLETRETLLTEVTVSKLLELLNESGCAAKLVNIDISGKCKVCKNFLTPVTVSNDQFELLKQGFFENVVKGDDIYQKTTPKEWSSFLEFVKNTAPYDIVLDGLNAAYSSNTIGQQKADDRTLMNVVKQLVDNNKRVLVIGRKHMNKWPRLKFIKSISNVYLVDNVSKDDIFLLYGALYSGPNAYILSRDFMRQHKFAIGSELNTIFKKWQQQCWYNFGFNASGQINMWQPIKFNMFCHKSNNYWHIPFIENNLGDTEVATKYEMPNNWACVKL